MFVGISCVLILSPALLIEQTIDPKVFPDGAHRWDRIGVFKLKDGKRDRLILLYYDDSDSVAEKNAEAGVPLIYIHPNCFYLNAIHQDAEGKWLHKVLRSGSRFHFHKVSHIGEDQVVLELHPVGVIQKAEDLPKLSKFEVITRSPFHWHVSFKEGSLTAKSVPRR